MKSLLTSEQKEAKIKYNRYKKLIRNLRRGKDEKISFKKADNNIPQNSRS